MATASANNSFPDRRYCGRATPTVDRSAPWALSIPSETPRCSDQSEREQCHTRDGRGCDCSSFQRHLHGFSPSLHGCRRCNTTPRCYRRVIDHHWLGENRRLHNTCRILFPSVAQPHGRLGGEAKFKNRAAEIVTPPQFCEPPASRALKSVLNPVRRFYC